MSSIVDANEELEHAAERARRRVTAARAALVKHVTDADPDHLISKAVADLVVTLAEAEGRHHALAIAVFAAQDGRDPRAAVAREVERGPDDSWSGRTNDARRANFDGVLEVLRDLGSARGSARW